MKFTKKGSAVCAIVLGISILATSALADVVIGSGYRTLKESAKTTTKFLTSDADSFSVDALVELKDDNTVYLSDGSTIRCDMKNNIKEEICKSVSAGRNMSGRDTYSYSDNEMDVWQYDGNKTVTYYNNGKDYDVINNEDPFEEEEIKDLEKVVDAFVGSLQDIIQVEENDGKKMFTGNIDSYQIPAYLNALASFGIKYSLFDDWNIENMNLPEVKNDIYVSNASGKAVVNEDGVITGGIATGEIRGKDKNGKEYSFTLELTYKLYDINETVIEKPDVSDAEVYYSEDSDKFYGLSKRNLGTHKGYIFENNDESKKIGERYIEISEFTEDGVKGKYWEVYDEGVDKTAKSFNFTAKSDKNIYGCVFDYTDENGEIKHASISDYDLGIISFEDDIVFSDQGGYSSNGRTLMMKQY